MSEFHKFFIFRSSNKYNDDRNNSDRNDNKCNENHNFYDSNDNNNCDRFASENHNYSYDRLYNDPNDTNPIR